MKKFYCLAGILLLVLGSGASYAQDQPASQVPPPPISGSLNLAGKFAVGSDSIRYDYAPYGPQNNAYTNTLTAVDAVLWLSNDDGIELLAGGGVSDNPLLDFNGNVTNYSNSVFGGGLGYRRNLSSPLKDLKLQALFRATYAHYDNTNLDLYRNNPYVTIQNNTVSEDSYYLMAGLGFEYFMPFCESLSVQSYVAYAASYDDGTASVNTNPNAAQYGVNPVPASYSYGLSYWRTSFLVNGLSLSTLAVHFYF